LAVKLPTWKAEIRKIEARGWVNSIEHGAEKAVKFSSDGDMGLVRRERL
jgi:hypothetical protein